MLRCESLRRRDRRAASGVRAKEGEELRKVALVGADGVVRGVLVQARCSRKSSRRSFIGGVGRRQDDASGHSVSSTPRGRRAPAARCARCGPPFSSAPSGRLPLERRDDAEGDVRRLVVFRIGVRDVIGQRADGRRPRRTPSVSPSHERGGIASGDESRGRRFDVAFDAGNLSGEEQVVARPRLPRLAQHCRPVDVRVAMDHPEAHELRVLEAGDQRRTRACSPHFICV